MAYIKTIPYPEASEELRVAYDQITGSRGKLAAVHMIQSLNPPALLSHMELYLTIMFRDSPLKRYQREMLGSIVSATNQCPYCVEHHLEALNFYWKDPNRTRQLVTDRASLSLSAKEEALCQWAEDLTQDPARTGQAGRVQELRDLGWDDRAILDATQVIAYFNFVNRMVLGLGVEWNEEEKTGYEY